MRQAFAIALLFTLCQWACAQSISFGPKLGITAGSPVPYSFIPPGAKGEIKPGRNIGMFINFEMNDRYSVTYEISSTRKHTGFETPLDNVPYIDRMQHPTMPHIVFEIDTWFNGVALGEFDNFFIEQALTHHIGITPKLNASIGMYSAWLHKSNTYAIGIGTVGYATEDTITQELDYSSKMREWDYGLKAGIQYKATKNIDCDLKISYGFESVFSDSFTLFNYPVHNTFIELSLYYKFRVFRKITNLKA